MPPEGRPVPLLRGLVARARGRRGARPHQSRAVRARAGRDTSRGHGRGAAEGGGWRGRASRPRPERSRPRPGHGGRGRSPTTALLRGRDRDPGRAVPARRVRCDGAGLGPPAGPRLPRPVARQRARRPRRRCTPRGSRAHHRPGSRDVTAARPGAPRRGADLRVAGADRPHEPCRRRPQRPVLPRTRAVRARGRIAAVHRLVSPFPRPRPHRPPTAAPRRAAPRLSLAARRPRRPVAAQAARGAIRDRRGGRSRPPRDRRRHRGRPDPVVRARPPRRRAAAATLRRAVRARRRGARAPRADACRGRRWPRAGVRVGLFGHRQVEARQRAPPTGRRGRRLVRHRQVRPLPARAPVHRLHPGRR